MDDCDIIALYWARDDRAIGETDAKYGRYCTAISLNILGSAEDSEENVNDTYWQAWNAMPPQRPALLGAFVGRIARNLALKRRKAARAEKRGGGLPPLPLDELSECLPDGQAVDSRLDAQALGKSISDYLRAQNEDMRRVFIRRYFSFEPVSAIAASLGFSESKVKSMLLRARRGLQKHLEREGFFL